MKQSVASAFIVLMLCLAFASAAFPPGAARAQSEVSSYGLTGTVGGVVLDPVNHDLYLPNYGGYVTVFSTSTDTVVGNFSVSQGDIMTGAVFDNASGKLYVEDEYLPGLWEIDPSTNKALANITTDYYGYPGGLELANGLLYLTDTTLSCVYAMSPTSNELLGNATLWTDPANSTAYDPQNGYLYVPGPSSNVTMAVNTADLGASVANITVPDQPTAAAYGGGKLYVTERLSNVAAVINPSTASVEGTITVGRTPTSGPDLISYLPNLGLLVANNDSTIAYIGLGASGPVAPLYFQLPNPATAMAYDPQNGVVYATATNSTGGSFLYYFTLPASVSTTSASSSSQTTASTTSTPPTSSSSSTTASTTSTSATATSTRSSSTTIASSSTTSSSGQTSSSAVSTTTATNIVFPTTSTTSSSSTQTSEGGSSSSTVTYIAVAAVLALVVIGAIALVLWRRGVIV